MLFYGDTAVSAYITLLALQDIFDYIGTEPPRTVSEKNKNDKANW